MAESWKKFAAAVGLVAAGATGLIREHNASEQETKVAAEKSEAEKQAMDKEIEASREQRKLADQLGKQLGEAKIKVEFASQDTKGNCEEKYKKLTLYILENYKSWLLYPSVESDFLLKQLGETEEIQDMVRNNPEFKQLVDAQIGEIQGRINLRHANRVMEYQGLLRLSTKEEEERNEQYENELKAEIERIKAIIQNQPR